MSNLFHGLHITLMSHHQIDSHQIYTLQYTMLDYLIGIVKFHNFYN